MINFDGLDIGGDTIRHNYFGQNVDYFVPSAPKFKLMPVSDVAEYKKGGRIRKRRNTGLKQKQKQSTNIKINIGGKEQQQQAPRIITQYVNGAQPVNLSELITKMNAIETKVSNQQPLSFMNDVLKQEFVDTLKNRISTASEEKNEKQPEEEVISGSGAAEATSSSSTSSSSSGSSKPVDDNKGFDGGKLAETEITWEGVKIYIAPSGTLMYHQNVAGGVVTDYLSKFAKSEAKKSKLSELYNALDRKKLSYKILTPKVL